MVTWKCSIFIAFSTRGGCYGRGSRGGGGWGGGEEKPNRGKWVHVLELKDSVVFSWEDGAYNSLWMSIFLYRSSVMCKWDCLAHLWLRTATQIASIQFKPAEDDLVHELSAVAVKEQELTREEDEGCVSLCDAFVQRQSSCDVTGFIRHSVSKCVGQQSQCVCVRGTKRKGKKHHCMLQRQQQQS